MRLKNWTYCSHNSGMSAAHRRRHCVRRGRQRRSQRSSIWLVGGPTEVWLRLVGLGRRRGSVARRRACCTSGRRRGRRRTPASCWQRYGARNAEEKYGDEEGSEADSVEGLVTFSYVGVARQFGGSFSLFSLFSSSSLSLVSVGWRAEVWLFVEASSVRDGGAVLVEVSVIGVVGMVECLLCSF